MQTFLSRLLMATALSVALALAGCGLPATSDAADAEVVTSDVDATVQAAVQATVNATLIEEAVRQTVEASGVEADADNAERSNEQPTEEATEEPTEESAEEAVEAVTIEDDTASDVDQSPVAGGEFNALFPQVAAPLDLVYTQEREGFAQAELSDDGEEVATLSVSDTNTNPSARDKFDGSDIEIAGYPAAAVGSQGTAILIDNRFQIQVRSRVDSFTEDDRSEWLSRFDLAGIAGLR